MNLNADNQGQENLGEDESIGGGIAFDDEHDDESIADESMNLDGGNGDGNGDGNGNGNEDDLPAREQDDQQEFEHASQQEVPPVASVQNDPASPSSAIASLGSIHSNNTSRKRSHPFDGSDIPKHLKTENNSCSTNERHQALYDGNEEDNEYCKWDVTAILKLTSLDELLHQKLNLLFHPSKWLRSQLLMDEDETALHYAIRKNAKRTAAALIQYFDDPVAGASASTASGTNALSISTGRDHNFLIHAETTKGVTPLILAAQKGNLECVKLLLERGAKVGHVTVHGTTAVLQAAHFGHFEILRMLLQHPQHLAQMSSGSNAGGNTNIIINNAGNLHPNSNLRLIELSNFHHTTPLMRAAQEGHLDIVKYLVERGALVNRKNCQCMTALMLASQRGHAKVCEYLIKVGHADMDATTESKSTPLLVACKRHHLKTIQVLVTAGCELFATDNRGRTAYDIAVSKLQQLNNNNNFTNNVSANSIRKMLTMLDPTYQVYCMRQAARQERSWALISMWTLLQKGRATLRGCAIHEWMAYFRGQDLTPPSYTTIPSAGDVYWKPSTLALVSMMTLPAPLVEVICQFAPLPDLWDTRISMLTKRALVNPNAALECGLDLMDEVLELGGYLRVLDQACIPPPAGHAGWTQWKAQNHCSPKVAAYSQFNNDDAVPRHQQRDRPNATIAQIPAPSLDSPSLVELRRHAGYLHVLSSNAPKLIPILTSPPYRLPSIIAQQLVTSSDIASLVRRVGSNGGVHFDTPIALDFIMLTSRLCSWYYSSAPCRATINSTYHHHHYDES